MLRGLAQQAASAGPPFLQHAQESHRALNIKVRRSMGTLGLLLCRHGRKEAVEAIKGATTWRRDWE